MIICWFLFVTILQSGWGNVTDTKCRNLKKSFQFLFSSFSAFAFIQTIFALIALNEKRISIQQNYFSFSVISPLHSPKCNLSLCFTLCSTLFNLSLNTFLLWWTATAEKHTFSHLHFTVISFKQKWHKFSYLASMLILCKLII